MGTDDKRVIATRARKTVYIDGDTVLKVFDEDYSKPDILNEALNLARIEETGIKVPRLLEVTVTSGKWAIRTEYIPGETLQALMDKDPGGFDEYLRLFVQIQADIFSHEAPMLNKLKDKMNRKISASGLDPTVRYELHTRLNAMLPHTKICHGDFNPSNVIIRPDGVPYIIDWAHVTQGNGAADAARTYLLFWLNGNIDGAEKYLDMFCIKNDTAKQYIQRWMPIVAASQLVKGKPAEREFLLHWVNVLDFE